MSGAFVVGAGIICLAIVALCFCMIEIDQTLERIAKALEREGKDKP